MAELENVFIYILYTDRYLEGDLKSLVNKISS